MDGIRFALGNDVPRRVAPGNVAGTAPTVPVRCGRSGPFPPAKVLNPSRATRTRASLASGIMRLVAVREVPHLGMGAQRLSGGNRTGSSGRSDGHLRKLGGMKGLRRQLALPRRLNQSFVILE